MALKWWQKAVFYQIYPRSFADGNDDGIGDFKGMIEKLDYLKDLGVDALWLSPHFPSPNWDWGYDISDYRGVAPEYGSLEDFKVFLAGAHQRGMKIILDLVLNHTSDQHAWFLESKSSRTNPKADWYIWVDTPPNNWQSCFDGDAWTYVPERKQYYYHYFMRQQPDLNWHNPELVAAMWNEARFWLDLGVDGYRLDAIGTLFEDPDLTPHSVPLNLAGLRYLSDQARTPEEHAQVAQYWQQMFEHQLGQAGVHEIMKQLRAVLDEYPDERMLVGEDDNLDYLGDGQDELQMVFNFPLMRTRLLSAGWVRKNQAERLAALAKISPAAWPCNTLGNHDCSRVYTQFGDGVHDAERARLSLALMLTLKGTPFLYYGEEIGMTNYYILDPARLRDTQATWYHERLLKDFNVEAGEAARRAAHESRDKNRTPMQWSNSPNAGFCPPEVSAWLPLNPNFSEGINVSDQQDDPLSLLNFYKRLLRVRNNNPALVEGEYIPLDESSEKTLSFLRRSPEQTVLVLLSFSNQSEMIQLAELPQNSARIIFSSAGRSRAKENLAEIHLGAFEILIAELQERP